ncbi:MAG: hypothetical protein MK135_15650 [Polyangiaceae bacterium]|nr:hypothetical protein [Polyangiaceae bacterium]
MMKKQIGWLGLAGVLGSLSVACDDATEESQVRAVQQTAVLASVGSMQLASGVESTVGSDAWVSVTLPNTYSEMVGA